MGVAAILISLLLALAVVELQGWMPRITRRIVQFAARRLQPTLRERMEEEWQAFVADVPGVVSPFVAACGCIRASLRLYRRPSQRAKRALDLPLAIALLVLQLPLMLFVGILVRLDSRGPALFSQDVVGRGGRVFRVYKFRTMQSGFGAPTSHDAARSDATSQARPFTDPRITRPGRFLRATRLDELPKLMSVASGHMSLVGPRPLSVPLALYLRERGELHTDLTPGLFWPSPIPEDQPQWQADVEVSRKYAENWSFGLELKIILTVLWRVFGAGMRK